MFKVKPDKLNINKKIEVAKKNSEPKRPIYLNIIKAFIVGGSICLIGELLVTIFNSFIDKELASNYMVMVLILISTILTTIGIYDRLGQFAGCGSIIPITGFANSMTSAAIESHSEGIVVGVINNVFKLAGSVIVTATMVGVFTGLIRYIGGVISG